MINIFAFSINRKLQQPEAAAGVLEYAMKHHESDLVGKIAESTKGKK